ncbi:MAG: hypothetical protein QGG23_03545 [Candidatus Bathyarchaeota archaeon]|nr:hypothetical protein [Candidatus Bathyarchaeota archaeon]
MSSRRKMLAADEEIANKLVEIAKRRGSTVYSTLNEILEQVLRADGMGLSLNNIIENREKIEKAKTLGFTFTVEKLLYEVVGLAYEKARDELAEIWHETGRWYGRYFADKGGDPVPSFKSALELLSLGKPVTSIEKQNGGRIVISCVGEMYTDGFTEMHGLFIRGVMETFGWEHTETENSKGMIRLTFTSPR